MSEYLPLIVVSVMVTVGLVIGAVAGCFLTLLNRLGDLVDKNGEMVDKVRMYETSKDDVQTGRLAARWQNENPPLTKTKISAEEQQKIDRVRRAVRKKEGSGTSEEEPRRRGGLRMSPADMAPPAPKKKE